MQQIIVVEGISNCGKTTLVEKFKGRDDFIILPEAIRYLERRLNLKKEQIMHEPKTYIEELLNQELLFDIEFEKIFDANKYLNLGKNVLIDKSSFAIMATAYAFEKNKDFFGGYALSSRYFNQLIDKVYRHGLIFPNKILLLDVNFETSQLRSKNRLNKLAPLWIDKKIMDDQRKVLTKLVKEVKNHLYLDTSYMTIQEVYELATAFIEQEV